MKLSIVGTGQMARGIGRLADLAGVEVLFAGQEISKAKALASEIGRNAKAGSFADAVAFSELIVLAIPFSSAANAIASLGDLHGKIIVDITNPLAADYMSLTIGHTTSAAEEIAKLAPRSSVVKAFNTVFASLMQSAHTSVNGQPLNSFVASDDENAKLKVIELATALGFDAIDAGALSNARYLEPMTEFLIQLAYGKGLGTNISFKLLK